MINVTTVKPEIEVGKPPLLKTARPKEVKIVLNVCDCYNDHLPTFFFFEIHEASRILGISINRLIGHAITAMLENKPQVVGCFRQAEIAETKLAQLQQVGPFIARACHSFDLQH